MWLSVNESMGIRDWRNGLRVLLVEDNILFGDALCDHLRSTGCCVTWVKGYRVAVDTLRGERFDILCLDRQLGDGDGFDLLRNEKPRCPTIIMSAFDQLTDRLEAKRLGAADYLTKPFRMEQLTHRIHLILPQFSGGSRATSKPSRFEAP